jgi:hypothetical protein
MTVFKMLSMHEAGREGFANMQLNEVEEHGESHIKELSDEYACDLIRKGEVISTITFPNQNLP